MGRSPTERAHDKSGRKSRSTTSNSSHHSNKSKAKKVSSRRLSMPIVREETVQHRRTDSDHEQGSSSDEDEVPGDHRAELAAARSKLTSPSLLSTLTSLTTATNNSGGSSGSNSTVTQASMTKQGVRQSEDSRDNSSPAVPVAAELFPDVFAFLDRDAKREHLEDEEIEDNEADDIDVEQDDTSPADEPWLAHHPVTSFTRLDKPLGNGPRSVSSSTSSSFHSDDVSEPVGDHETDRSTSPERSIESDGERDEEPEVDEEEDDDDEDESRPPNVPVVKRTFVDENEDFDDEVEGNEQNDGEGDHVRHDTNVSTDPSSAKIASQIRAAHHRQTIHSTNHLHHRSPASRPPTIHPPPSPSTTSSHMPAPHRRQQMRKHQTSMIPSTGYDSLAQSLAVPASPLPQIYRKFSALNHRLLLHLQDELAELEDQLHHLDKADTQARRVNGPHPHESHILPASRRAAARSNGPLEWHKHDVMAKIGFKLAQYNQTLTSFTAAQALPNPAASDVSGYYEFLRREQPIVETEAAFLKHSDLALLSGPPPTRALAKGVSRPVAAHSPSRAHHQDQELASRPQDDRSLPLAVAVAIAVLIPTITFPVIPGFVGCMTVVLLVAVGVVGASVQANGVGAGANSWRDRDNLGWALLYAAVMMVVARVAR